VKECPAVFSGWLNGRSDRNSARWRCTLLPCSRIVRLNGNRSHLDALSSRSLLLPRRSTSHGLSPSYLKNNPPASRKPPIFRACNSCLFLLRATLPHYLACIPKTEERQRSYCSASPFEGSSSYTPLDRGECYCLVPSTSCGPWARPPLTAQIAS
jgi:hypothetical protein